MQQHFFSIIIASRNVDPYLIKEGFPAIDSLKYTNFEVLLVLDSIDKTSEEMNEKYSWLRILKLHNKPGDKRDLAAKKAKGTILAFIDADVAPRKDWLQKAANVFTKRSEIVGLGGPGVLPKKVNIWETIFDEVLQSWLGGGGYTYRFIPQPERFVDDYPSMNLFVKKDVFLKIGGFQNMYWPGEDSKLANNLVHKNNYSILYHPDVVVYHHRRDTLAGHIDQYKRYGETRGTFFIQGDKNSFRLPYLIPGLFFMYMVLYILSALLFILKPYNPLHFILITIPVAIYMLLLLVVAIQSFMRTKNILITLGIFAILPLTHFIYGLHFLKATMIEMFKKQSA
jgi:cellulose synthase/poly-beta-1,6-N-acetylglucosamine synthase-like glycosyltransferase